MAERHPRHWIARCRYHGRSPFCFGTFQADSELAALREAKEVWQKISPHPSPSFDMEPGMVIINFGEDHG